MIFTCDSVDAAEAYRIGLVNKVVAPEELMNTAKAMSKKIISKGSYAVSVAKAAINNGYDMDIKNAVEMEANLFGVISDYLYAFFTPPSKPTPPASSPQQELP